MRKWLGAVLGGAAIISAAAVSAQTWGDESLDSVTARPAETAASASGITPPAEKVDEAAEVAEIKAGACGEYGQSPGFAQCTDH